MDVISISAIALSVIFIFIAVRLCIYYATNEKILKDFSDHLRSQIRGDVNLIMDDISELNKKIDSLDKKMDRIQSKLEELGNRVAWTEGSLFSMQRSPEVKAEIVRRRRQRVEHKGE